MKAKVAGDGTKAKPWKLKTPSGSSEYEMYRAEDADPPAIVCMVGKTELRYHLRAIEDLHAMLKKHGDWMALGSADEQKPAPEGSVEAALSVPPVEHVEAEDALVLAEDRQALPPGHRGQGHPDQTACQGGDAATLLRAEL